jgi:hypothetical protein
MPTLALGAGEVVAGGGIESMGGAQPGRMTSQRTQRSGNSKRDVVVDTHCIISNTSFLSSTHE